MQIDRTIHSVCRGTDCVCCNTTALAMVAHIRDCTRMHWDNAFQVPLNPIQLERAGIFENLHIQSSWIPQRVSQGFIWLNRSD